MPDDDGDERGGADDGEDAAGSVDVRPEAGARWGAPALGFLAGPGLGRRGRVEALLLLLGRKPEGLAPGAACRRGHRAVG